MDNATISIMAATLLRDGYRTRQGAVTEALAIADEVERQQALRSTKEPYTRMTGSIAYRHADYVGKSF